jgi:hypothetical protein
MSEINELQALGETDEQDTPQVEVSSKSTASVVC